MGSGKCVCVCVCVSHTCTHTHLLRERVMADIIADSLGPTALLTVTVILKSVNSFRPEIWVDYRELSPVRGISLTRTIPSNTFTVTPVIGLSPSKLLVQERSRLVSPILETIRLVGGAGGTVRVCVCVCACEK